MLSFFNTYLFSWLCPIILLCAGGFLFLKLRVFSLLKPSCIRAVFQKEDRKNATSPFRALCMALAGTLGVGNIVGVASAIAIGGAGAVFWMVVSALFAMSLKYAETVLALRYRKSDGENVHGGPMYYIQNGLHRPIWAKIFCVLCVGASFLIGNFVQTQALLHSLEYAFDLPANAVAVCFAILIFAVGMGGGKRIGAVTERLIPILTILYLALSFAVLIQNASRLPMVTAEIFRQAFSLKPVVGGAIGFGMQNAVRYGVARGLMSNEAGCGTAPIAHAASGNSPAKQGIWGIFEVTIDTVLLCTVTAYVLLLAPQNHAPDAMEFALQSYGSFYGVWMIKALALAIVCFAFASVIGWSFYGTEALSFLCKRKGAVRAYLFLYALASVLAPSFSERSVLDVTDFFVYALTILNTLCVLLLAREAEKETKDFQKSVEKKKGFSPHEKGVNFR